MRLEGKTVLITGGNEGIGKATALLFAKEGAQVGITGRRKKKLDEVVKESGGAITAFPGDVSNESDVKATVKDFIKKFGKIDVLFNNAGILETGTVVSTPVKTWDKMMDINLRGMFLMTRYVIPHMIKNGGGSIINNGSVLSYIGAANTIAYNTTKGAVLQFTRSLAMDHAKDKIRINTVCPTFIRTPLTSATFADPERVAWIEDRIKLGRVGEVEDIMGAIAFLASDAAALVTGTALMVDGGWTAE